MANSVLFVSSVSIACIHVAAQLWYQQKNIVLTTTMACGIATSVWNHGVTSSLAKIADRVMMWIGFFSNLYSIWNVRDYTRQTLCLLALLAAALLYSVAKVLIKWRSSTHVANVPHTALEVYKGIDQRSHMSQRQRSLLSLPDLPHLFAHCSLTATHVLLMDAYSQELRVDSFFVQQ